MAATKTYRLLCLENPLLDIIADGDQTLLDKYSLKANDAILAEPQHLAIYEDLLTNRKAILSAGGAAQNTARGAQYMLSPDSVVFLGGVGRDKYADILAETAAKAGLRVEYRVDDKEATGRCAVVVTPGHRSMVTELAAANHYDLGHLQSAAIWPLVEAAEAYYIGGYHLTVCPPAIMALAHEAAARNKTFILSISAPFIPLAFKDALDATLPYLDYVLGNEGEAVAFGNAHGLCNIDLADIDNVSTDELKAIAKHLANLPKANAQRKRVAIVTHGSKPTIVAVQGDADVLEFAVLPIAAADIVDTTGAGDAFAAGLAAGIIEGSSLEQSIKQGQWLARLSLTQLGASYVA
ncbi:adenosine kinase [Grosmannia clavigera kw1407]|uniref:Adenosine kinase n=1 Tax=Grosmannia clavigera (strain kw1407 / UAMH 11150) TaxID=655863 RepID=F0XHM3_GROCL|nr:adenosine kinase [Grosmannia clavigera kw1407]EFX02863.1 adenosine kinase [Grosmannia clavigera kw1407]